MTGDEVKKETMVMGNSSDIEVASKVRMLMRNDIDHEVVCMAGRDRIMYLSQQLELAENEIIKTQYSLHCMEQSGAFLGNALDQKMARGLVDSLGNHLKANS